MAQESADCQDRAMRDRRDDLPGRKIMTRSMAWRAAAVVMFVVASGACATTQEASKPGVVAVDVIEFTSSVEAIDYQKRTVVLKGPDGKRRSFTASKDVRNLEQVKTGDLVKVELIEELALFVRKASDPPEVTETTAVGLAPKGKKPGVMFVDTTQVTANVEAVDYQKRTITLRGPQGNVGTYKVGDAVKRLNEVKTGDQVVLRVTDALAILVEKP
jgi:hypothetical protein